MIKIFEEDIYWKGRKLIFTWHFKKEFEETRKNLEFVIAILEEGEHKLSSKRQQKYEVHYWLRDRWLCLVYALHEDIIVLIHIKPKRK